MTSSSPSAIEDGSKIVSLSSKIMVATILFIFIMVVFLFAIYLYTKWYNSRHENPTIVSWRRQTARQRRSATSTQLRGLENSTLELLPSVEYKAKDLNEKLECSVCLCEVLEGEKIRVLPKCSHKFHVECIDMWFSSHSSCPLCRTPVVSHSSHDINDVVLQQSGGGAGNASNFDDYHVHGVQLETNALPTNTMSLENEAQVSPIMAQAKVGSEQDKNAIASSSSSNSIDVSRLRDGLAIEIPSELCHDCLSSPLSGARFDEDEPRSPSLTTFRSLKRLLSRGKRVLVPSPTASSSAHV